MAKGAWKQTCLKLNVQTKSQSRLVRRFKLRASFVNGQVVSVRKPWTLESALISISPCSGADPFKIVSATMTHGMTSAEMSKSNLSTV